MVSRAAAWESTEVGGGTQSTDSATRRKTQTGIAHHCDGERLGRKRIVGLSCGHCLGVRCCCLWRRMRSTVVAASESGRAKCWAMVVATVASVFVEGECSCCCAGSTRPWMRDSQFHCRSRWLSRCECGLFAGTNCSVTGQNQCSHWHWTARKC